MSFVEILSATILVVFTNFYRQTINFLLIKIKKVWRSRCFCVSLHWFSFALGLFLPSAPAPLFLLTRCKDKQIAKNNQTFCELFFADSLVLTIINAKRKETMEKRDMVQMLVDKFDGGNKKRFAQRLGMTPQALSTWFKRNTFVADKIIAGCEGVSPEWLLTGEGSMMRITTLPADNGIGIVERTEDYKKNSKPRIPFSVAAGSLAVMEDGAMPSDCEYLPIIKQFPNYDFTMIVKGNSMTPAYEGGDEIALKRVTDYIEWGKAYVLDTQDGAILKRVYEDGDKIRCVSYNSEEYPDFFVDKKSINGFYKVVGLLRCGQ